MICGGFSSTQEHNEDVQTILNQVKETFETETNRKYDTFYAHSHKTQVVAGLNYLIKVHLGNKEYAHIKIYKRFDADAVISAYKLNMNERDELSTL